MARLHVIFHDAPRAEVGHYLAIGTMQLVLAMIEAGNMNPRLLLDDPVSAMHAWSRDPLLKTRVPMADGSQRTAVELQMLFLEEAARFVAAGGCEGIVPEAESILRLWGDTLEKLAAQNFEALAPRLDWVRKLSIIERALRQRAGLGFESPEIKHLDHFYGALNGGLYETYRDMGAMDRIVTGEEIALRTVEPPEDTRAWARSQLLRIAGPENIARVDWDEITFKLDHQWPRRRTVSLADPLGYTKAKTRFLETATLEDAIDILGGEPAAVPAPVVARTLSDFQNSLPKSPAATRKNQP